MDAEQLTIKICSLDASVTAFESGVDRAAVAVPAATLPALMTQLRDGDELSFEMLLDHTAIDWPDAGEFELIYQLFSLKYNHYLMVSVRIPRDNPVVPTVSSIWACAEFQEREVYDLFGVLYDAHPDLRRLFLEDAWEGFPLRKDYEDDFMLERGK